MKKIEKLSNTNEIKKEVAKFIKKYDKTFKPPISKQVEISDYVYKVFEKGYFLGATLESKIKGLIGFYCNDREEYRGYITYLAVGKGVRGRGVGGNLVDECIDKCAEEGMKKVRVQTWSDNKSAIRLYRQRGFEFVEKYVNELSIEKVVLERIIK